MPRSALIRSEIHTYHVTARTNDRQFYPIMMNAVWKIFIDELKLVQERFGICIHAFVLMDNHFHLLVQTPRSNLDQVMHLLMRNTAVKIMRKADGTNHLWGGRYKWSLIESHAYYYQVYRYIYQNPLRARMVNKVELYPYSTLTSRVPFPLHSRVNIEMGGMLLNYCGLMKESITKVKRSFAKVSDAGSLISIRRKLNYLRH